MFSRSRAGMLCSRVNVTCATQTACIRGQTSAHTHMATVTLLVRQLLCYWSGNCYAPGQATCQLISIDNDNNLSLEPLVYGDISETSSSAETHSWGPATRIYRNTDLRNTDLRNTDLRNGWTNKISTLLQIGRAHV